MLLLHSFALVLLACTWNLVQAVKFDVQASASPALKCIWNYAMADTLVVITANVEKGGLGNQRVDMEIIDGSNHRNIYQTKRNVMGETRIAITTHADADLGVCFRNHLDNSESGARVFMPVSYIHLWNAEISAAQAPRYKRAIDLDIDIGSEAVDYNAIAKQGQFMTSSVASNSI